MSVQYTEKVDTVIYGHCRDFDDLDFLQLAAAALDQVSTQCVVASSAHMSADTMRFLIDVIQRSEEA